MNLLQLSRAHYRDNLRDFVWTQVALHLKPRHLAKLLRTCKHLNALLGENNDYYWTRVAAHIVWRNNDAVEVMTIRSPGDVLPPIPDDHNLYYMLALDHGYFWGMELFFKRLEETIQYYSVNDINQEHCAWWTALKAMSLEEKTRWMLREEETRHWMKQDVETRSNTVSMRAIVKMHTLATVSQSDKSLNQFLCDIEDDPMPPVFKRRIMRRLEDCLWSACKRDHPLYPSDLACRICKF